MSIASTPSLREWISRARALIPRDDRRVLLSPPGLVTRSARYALRRHSDRVEALSTADVRRCDPELISLCDELLAFLAKHYLAMLSRPEETAS